MKEIPLLFSTETAQALLAGRKTQTRRLVKWPAVPEWHDRDYEPDTIERRGEGNWWPAFSHRGFNKDISGPVKCTYGQPGDLLWVRETWAPYLRGTEGDGYVELIKYKADGSELPFKHVKDYAELGWHNRPGIHMNKEYARIWLQKTATKVERACDISREDAIAEGLACITKDNGRTYKYGIPDLDGYPGTDDNGWPWEEWEVDPVAAFKKLWCKINGIETWNSWVWVNSFNVLSTTGKPSTLTEKMEG